MERACRERQLLHRAREQRLRGGHQQLLAVAPHLEGPHLRVGDHARAGQPFGLQVARRRHALADHLG